MFFIWVDIFNHFGKYLDTFSPNIVSVPLCLFFQISNYIYIHYSIYIVYIYIHVKPFAKSHMSLKFFLYFSSISFHHISSGSSLLTYDLLFLCSDVSNMLLNLPIELLLSFIMFFSTRISIWLLKIHLIDKIHFVIYFLKHSIHRNFEDHVW